VTATMVSVAVTAGTNERMWARLHALVDQASTADLVSHRLQVVAVHRYRSTAREIPAAFAEEERLAALRDLVARPLLERIASVYGGPMILLKGPEVAGLYPQPEMRPFGDLDLLVEDAVAAQRALRAAGFEELHLPIAIHHLQPLWSPGLPLPVEIHSRLHWIESMPAPSVRELFDVAEPSRVAVAGIGALPPEHHVLVLAVHSWAHEPLRRLRDIVDIALALSHADSAEVERLARRWELTRLWQTTRRAVESLRDDAPPSLALRTWGRNLRAGRERTVFEDHMEHWFSDLSVMPPGRAIRRMPHKVARDLLPERDEMWRTKVRRSVRALRNARRPRSLHQDELDERGMAGPSRRASRSELPLVRDERSGGNTRDCRARRNVRRHHRSGGDECAFADPDAGHDDGA
jgi:hypothetical protein